MALIAVTREEFGTKAWIRHCEECNDLGGSHAADGDMAIHEVRVMDCRAGRHCEERSDVAIAMTSRGSQ